MRLLFALPGRFTTLTVRPQDMAHLDNCANDNPGALQAALEKALKSGKGLPDQGFGEFHRQKAAGQYREFMGRLVQEAAQ